MTAKSNCGKGGSHQVVNTPEPGTATPDWDEVDEAGWESFPASDPPAFGPPWRKPARRISPPARPAESVPRKQSDQADSR